MNNQIVAADKNELMVKYTVDGNEIKLTPSIVEKYIVGNNAHITTPEFKFFTELCKARGLNPFLKEAYCIKYGDKPAQIVVGKDAIIKRAVRDSAYDGMESGVIVQVKETGEILERKGTFYIPTEETLVGGWARVFRKDWKHPTYVSVGFAEVAQRAGNGNLNSNWATKGATMVEKVAKVRALRESFIEQLGGMYDEDEIRTEAPEEVKHNEEVIQQDEPIEEAPAEAISMDEL